MKYFIYIIVFGCMISVSTFGQRNQFNKNLLKPDARSFSKKLGERSIKFKKMLDENQLKEFYSAVQPFFSELNKMQWDKMSREEVSDLMWCFYLICGAPLYEVDFTTEQTWPYEKDNDILAKTGAASFITTFDIQSISRITGIKNKYLENINSIYFSTILKTLRSSYISDLKEKMPGLQEEAFETLKAQPYLLQNRLGKLSVLERRNNAINSLISSLLEEQFVNMLVRYFPNKSNEVLKYIKMAGYEGSEISELIDRTVGRDSKTEYLYKGRVGHEHEKRIKKQNKDK